MLFISRRTLLSGLAAPLRAGRGAGGAVGAGCPDRGHGRHGHPGIAAMVIRDFKAEPELVAGIRRLARRPVVPGERWHLGSDGKAMTVTLIARLVEHGRAGLGPAA